VTNKRKSLWLVKTQAHIIEKKSLPRPPEKKKEKKIRPIYCLDLVIYNTDPYNNNNNNNKIHTFLPSKPFFLVRLSKVCQDRSLQS